MKSYIFIASFLFIFSCNKPSNQNTIVQNAQGIKLDSILTPYIKNIRKLTNNKAGLAIGVIKGNTTIYEHYYGFADISNHQKVDANTSFHIASLSKPFVAVAVLKLIEKGKLDLNDKIVDIVPEFKMNDTAYHKITVKHILTHTSGIPANIKTNDWTEPSFGKGALLENLEIIKNCELDFVPGTKFSYSNSAFDLLGIIIERVSKISFADFVKKEVFTPIGMNTTSFYKHDDFINKNLAKAYSYGLETQEWKPYPYNERLFPSSGIITNLNDMLKWTSFHLGKGTFNNKVVINEKSFNQLTKPQFKTPWNDAIGLSWFLQSYLEKPIIMHQGQDTGFESLVYIYPKENISIVVLANRDFSRTARIINATSEVLFNKKPKKITISAKYPFTKEYKNKGITAAKEYWIQLKKDSTDVYYTNDNDILTTAAILENAKHWNETKEMLEFYNSLNNKSTYAWRLLGNANLNLGDTITALLNYKKCLAINPDYSKAKNAISNLKTN